MKVKTAQIGVGYWGPNLLRNLAGNKQCELRWVADLSQERREYVKALYPAAQVTSDIEQILADAEVEAIVISTPVATHYDLTMRALENGKHVLVEKPMATTVKEAEEIERRAKEKGRVAMVGHTFLYNDAVRYVKQLIESGDLGEVRYIYCQRLNLGRIRSDVDALWNFAPHDVSIIQYWLNDLAPLSVTRHGMDYVQPGIEDVVFLNIVYPNRVMANVHVSWLDPHKVRSITVVGSKKMVVYDDVADNKIAIYDKGIDPKAVLGKRMDFDNPGYKEFNHRSGDLLMPQINFREPISVEIAHFMDCIQNGTPCLTGPAHAKGVIQILSMGRKL